MTWQEFRDEVERQLHNLDLNERVEISWIDVSSRDLDDFNWNIEVSEDDDGAISIDMFDRTVEFST